MRVPITILLMALTCFFAPGPVGAKQTKPQGVGSLEQLRKEFVTPGVQYRALPMHMDWKDTAKYAEWLSEGGWGGAHFNYPHGGPTYLQDPAGWEQFKSAVSACKEKGLLVWIYDEMGYPSGRAGGLTLKDHPEYEAQGLFYDCIDVAKKNKEQIEWKIPEGKPFYVALCQLDWAGRIEGEPIEVTNKTQDGMLRVDIEPGEWRIVAFVQNRLFEGTHASLTFGPYLNIMDPAAVKRFIEVTYDAYYRQCGADFGKTIPAIFTDEPSVMTGYLAPGEHKYAAIPWYSGLPDLFKKRAGYDIRQVLPALFNDAGQPTITRRCDFYSTIASAIADSYFGQIGDWCREYNIKFTGHLVWEESLIYHANFYGSVFPSLARFDWPGIDVLGCGYGHTGGARTEGGPVTPKLISSAARLYGKKRTMSESFCFVTNKTPVDDLLSHIAWQEVLGINSFTTLSIHAQYQPADFRRLNDYIGRLSSVLTQGRAVADVAVLYPIASVWADFIPTKRHVSSVGDNPKIKDVDDAWREVTAAVLGSQRDFDYVAEDDITGSLVSSGSIDIGENRYLVLVLPHVTTLRYSTLQKIMKFVETGGTVITYESVPKSREDAGSVEEFRALVDNLLDGQSRRKGKVVHVETLRALENALLDMPGADLQVEPRTADVYYQHRVLDSSDAYFMVNNSEQPLSGRFAFRAVGRAQIWDPLTGEVKTISAKKSGGKSVIDLTLPRRNGLFVIFEH